VGQQGVRSADVSTLAQCSTNQLRGQLQFQQQCKKRTLISTFNVCILNTLKQLPELVFSAIKLNIEVICVKEHRFNHPDIKLKYHDIGKDFYLSIRMEELCQLLCNYWCVSMLLSPATIRALNSIKEIEPKILIANFNGYSTKTIISCYSPTNVSDIEDVENLKESLSSLVRLAPSIIFK